MVGTPSGIRASSLIRHSSFGNSSFSLFFVDDGDVAAAALFQKLPRLQLGEPRIACFNDQEKSVVRGAAKPAPVEDRVIPARQSVHHEQREKGGERGEEH